MAKEPPTADSGNLRFLGNLMLGLSLLTFAVFFLNVLIGGPMRSKPWMSDVQEMLTLFLAVIFFVAGTLAREAQRRLRDGQTPPSGTPDVLGNETAPQGIKPV